jgi:alkanesulfonate monooxygenase SsuD/methylene tetrahydromethanopterin reductase-like flavin-dependent oxidoreductase (luciferase family)
MRIGLPGLGAPVEPVIRQALRAEAEGFTSLWYTSAVAGDPLLAIAFAGRATERIELGTAVVPTYGIHPVTLAAQAAAVASSLDDPGRLTLGLGPSHQPFVEALLGVHYETVRADGEDFRLTAGPPPLPDGHHVSVLVAALGPRLSRVAGQHAAGAIPWMANARAVERHIAPRATKAAADAGRPAPRIVAGLPVAVHDDTDAARAAAADQFAVYGTLVNYQRVLERGDATGPADVAIVGDEADVAAQIEALFEAGATDVWAAPFPVGDDRAASRARTRALLVELANS